MPAPSVRITVRFFAAARERAGRGEEALTLEVGATVADALKLLEQRHPTLTSLLPHLRVAVDQDFVPSDTPLAEGAELALIPPVSGGAPPQPLFSVVAHPLKLDDVVRAVADPAHGGVVTFAGAVRDQTRQRSVERLEYEAFVPMAERMLRAIAAEAATRWPEVRLAAMHRVGTLALGELAVVVASSAPHRQEAFLACQFFIDRLKQDAPIWKKEFFEDGAVWVGLGA